MIAADIEPLSIKKKTSVGPRSPMAAVATRKSYVQNSPLARSKARRSTSPGPQSDEISPIAGPSLSGFQERLMRLADTTRDDASFF